MSKNVDEVHVFKKTNQPKSIQIPLSGNSDCYMEITVTEHHGQAPYCAHLYNSLDQLLIPSKPSNETYKNGKIIKPEEGTVKPNDGVNVNNLVPQNDIGKLNDLLSKIIHSKAVKMVEVSVGDITGYPQCSNCAAPDCCCVTSKIERPEAKQTPQEMPEPKETATIQQVLPYNEIDKLNGLLKAVIQSKSKVNEEGIGKVAACSCTSPDCCCGGVKDAPSEFPKQNSNQPKRTSLIPTVDSKKRSKTQHVTNYDDFISPYINDLPLEGHNQPVSQIQDDINDLAQEIYSPEEREKNLRLLRLLVQEAMSEGVPNKNNIPIMNKTIAIPHFLGHDLKTTDSLTIRIIVEKEI